MLVKDQRVGALKTEAVLKTTEQTQIKNKLLLTKCPNLGSEV